MSVVTCLWRAGWRRLLPVTGWAAFEDKESDTCVVCHEAETQEWSASPHARTINDRFWPSGNTRGRNGSAGLPHQPVRSPER